LIKLRNGAFGLADPVEYIRQRLIELVGKLARKGQLEGKESA
jgi:hypothetical protein